MDALSSAVVMKLNLDLQLTLMPSSLYRLLSYKIGNGYRNVKFRKIFRDFVDVTEKVIIIEKVILAPFQKRVQNPLVIAAGFDKTDIPIPWSGGKRLRLIFG